MKIILLLWTIHICSAREKVKSGCQVCREMSGLELKTEIKVGIDFINLTEKHVKIEKGKNVRMGS